MSSLHSQTIAAHLLATGGQMVIDGKSVVGKKRLFTFAESREMNLHPKTIAYRISAPKSEMDFEPVSGLRTKVDDEIFTIGESRDLGAYYRFDVSRFGK